MDAQSHKPLLTVRRGVYVILVQVLCHFGDINVCQFLKHICISGKLEGLMFPVPGNVFLFVVELCEESYHLH